MTTKVHNLDIGQMVSYVYFYEHGDLNHVKGCLNKLESKQKGGIVNGKNKYDPFNENEYGRNFLHVIHHLFYYIHVSMYYLYHGGVVYQKLGDRKNDGPLIPCATWRISACVAIKRHRV